MCPWTLHTISEISSELHAPLIFTVEEQTSEYIVELFSNGDVWDHKHKAGI
jgi:hypothetical protein